jgi:neutral ceramidase
MHALTLQLAQATLSQVSHYSAGAAPAAGDSVSATFRAGCPRNNLRTNGTFLAVERLDNISLTWQVVHTDDDWCTKFR